MESSVLGGGLLIAVAAALWLIYLVPNWLRRREYLATERNAVRLQQTIRVLAETAETPEAVRVESAARARVLARELADRPVAVGAPVLTPLPASLDPKARATARLRRTRLIVALVTGVALVVVLVQVVIALVAGVAAVSVVVAVGAALGTATGIAMLGRLAKVSRERGSTVTAAPAVRATRSMALHDLPVETAPPSRAREWTPVPIPRPTYLDRPAVQQPSAAEVARAAARAEAELSEASEVAEKAIRGAHETVPAVAPAASSRFASMGVVDAAVAPAMPDIDRALRRRRAS
jgi:hypothetical protein